MESMLKEEARRTISARIADKEVVLMGRNKEKK